MNSQSMLKVCSIIIAAPVLTVACAAGSTAVSVRTGDSAAYIEQRGGHYPSQLRVYRHAGGHTVITEDGRNTDITIQGKWPAAHSRVRPGRPDATVEEHNRFDHPELRHRFTDPFAQ